MIEIKRPPPEPPRYSDPEELLAGKCMSCSTVVNCLRKDAVQRKDNHEPGTWSDLVSAECPKCGARVFVMTAVEFAKIVKK